MFEFVKPFAEACAVALELIGILIIAGLATVALVRALLGFTRREQSSDIFQMLRQRLGHGILLGLEFLVAADIIHTVVVELTIQNVAVLAVIVLIRTLLSFSIELELTGRWPWQQPKK